MTRPTPRTAASGGLMIGMKLSTLQTPRLVTVSSAGRIRRASGIAAADVARRRWRISSEICSTVLAAGEATGTTYNSSVVIHGHADRVGLQRHQPLAVEPAAEAVEPADGLGHGKHEERVPGQLDAGSAALRRATMAEALALVWR